MTDLTDFGVGVGEEPTKEEPDEPEEVYPNGRCPAIVSDRRCKNPTSRMVKARPFCGTHGGHGSDDPLNINSQPTRLMAHVSGSTARCRALQQNGARCANSCLPYEYRCGLHQGTDADLASEESLVDGEVHAELIRAAVKPQTLLHEGTLPVVEGRLWLPRELQRASQLVVRQRSVTSDWKSYHGLGWDNWVGLERNDCSDEEAQNPHLDPLEASIKRYGHEAETHPIKVLSEGAPEEDTDE